MLAYFSSLRFQNNTRQTVQNYCFETRIKLTGTQFCHDLVGYYGHDNINY